jgi:hypothetical protein
MVSGCEEHPVCEGQLDAYLGVYISSAQCISELKKIAIRDYYNFEYEFSNTYTQQGEKLSDKMRFGPELNLWVAWSHYVSVKLAETGHDQIWKRIYIKASPFEALIASLSTVHFSARFPLMDCAPNEPGLLDHYNLRMHSYIFSVQAQSVDQNIHKKTLDLRKDFVLSPALQYVDAMEYKDYQFLQTQLAFQRGAHP